MTLPRMFNIHFRPCLIIFNLIIFTYFSLKKKKKKEEEEVETAAANENGTKTKN
jgi:hypothetical protein